MRHHVVFTAHAAIVVDAEIPADADQPCGEVRTAIERLERLEQLEKDVLSEIFGFVLAADEFVRDVEHLAPVETHDVVPRALITFEATFDEGIDLRWRRSGRVNSHPSRAALRWRECAHDNMRFARVPTVPARRWRTCLRRRQHPVDRRTRSHTYLHLQRARDPRKLSRYRRGVRVVPA